MARTLSRLTALRVARINAKGRHADGGGLYLQVSATCTKSWVYRYMLRGRTRDMGLGPYPEITLGEAREKAMDCRRKRLAGDDPIEARKRARFARQPPPLKEMTFGECAEAYIQAHSASWRNEKHLKQWSSTITTYAAPIFGKSPVGAIDLQLVMKSLQPIWATKPVTANRLRGRIEQVLDWAKTLGYRQGDNPARWRGHLENLLPAPTRVRSVRHHPALPYRDIASFISQLRQESCVAAVACEFLILTATRTSETLGARWDEVNFERRIWTIPNTRMKARQGHRIPLSPRALATIERMDTIRHDEYIFPSRRAGRPLSNMALLALLRRMGRQDITTHGFRSTFRDWTAEETDFSGEIAEAALAHIVGNKVEAAYRRGDLFEKRRLLMAQWANYCDTPSNLECISVQVADLLDSYKKIINRPCFPN